MHPSCWYQPPPPFVLLIFNLLCKLWGVITFEWVFSLCWNFQDNLILYIPFIWNSFIKIWDGSCPALVHLTWNDPTVFFQKHAFLFRCFSFMKWNHGENLYQKYADTFLENKLSSFLEKKWTFLKLKIKHV